MLVGFVRCNGGLDNGTALSSFGGRRGQVVPAPQLRHRRRAGRIRRGALMVAQVWFCRAGQRASAETRPRDQPPERRSRIQDQAARRQRAACATEVDAAESLLLLSNSGDRCLPPSVQKQDGRCNKPRRSPTGDNPIAAERRWPSPPELPRPQSRTRLSNGLPFTGEALNSRSIIHRRPSPP
jgi:hypothetical protein